MKKGWGRLFVVVILGLQVLKGDDDVTLTTAVIVDATTPKPTMIHRRIHIDPHMLKTERAPLDLFRFRAHDVRRIRGDIWNYDYWCQLQPKKGNGSQNMTRFYYDAQIDQCLPFYYLGSKGNKNNFNTLQDCERYCKGAAYMSIKETTQSTFCSLQPHAGLCMGMFYRYYYDINEDRCKTFIYGGCGGNQNRFDTKRECLSSCNDH